jgi:hypothetical protein
MFRNLFASAVALSLCSIGQQVTRASDPVVVSIGPLTFQGTHSFLSDEPNGLDLNSFEEVSFVGTIKNTHVISLATVFVRFSYPNPLGQTVFGELSPTVVLSAGESTEFSFSSTLPYCPELVVLNMFVRGGPVSITGTMTHVCVPESSSLIYSSCGVLVATYLWVFRRASLKA